LHRQAERLRNQSEQLHREAERLHNPFFFPRKTILPLRNASFRLRKKIAGSRNTTFHLHNGFCTLHEIIFRSLCTEKISDIVSARVVERDFLLCKLFASIAACMKSKPPKPKAFDNRDFCCNRLSPARIR
jgi:hypothetical protein